jgi:predicted ATPase
MIKIFRAKNYGCLKSVEANLTPVHAFIGPNDSGKSTLLRGLQTVFQIVHKRYEHELENTEAFFLECVLDGGSYAIEFKRGFITKHLNDVHHRPLGLSVGNVSPDERAERAAAQKQVISQLRSVLMVRFDPDALRAPSGLIPDSETVQFLDERGTGLPGVYFALRNRGDDVFNSVIDAARKHFPTIKTIRLKAVTTNTLELEIELLNGVRVGARQMSEGLLYFLAFAAIRHLDPPSLLLVEEPENGLHPARIREVVRMLRTIAEEMGTQVVMATHSPLVVNELKPEEVTVVTRPSLEEGTKLTPIKETHNFEKRSSVYALGELWLSYADGELENPLIKGPDA